MVGVVVQDGDADAAGPQQPPHVVPEATEPGHDHRIAIVDRIGGALLLLLGAEVGQDHVLGQQEQQWRDRHRDRHGNGQGVGDGVGEHAALQCHREEHEGKLTPLGQSESKECALVERHAEARAKHPEHRQLDHNQSDHDARDLKPVGAQHVEVQRGAD